MANNHRRAQFLEKKPMLNAFSYKRIYSCIPAINHRAAFAEQRPSTFFGPLLSVMNPQIQTPERKWWPRRCPRLSVSNTSKSNFDLALRRHHIKKRGSHSAPCYTSTKWLAYCETGFTESLFIVEFKWESQELSIKKHDLLALIGATLASSMPLRFWLWGRWAEVSDPRTHMEICNDKKR